METAHLWLEYKLLEAHCRLVLEEKKLYRLNACQEPASPKQIQAPDTKNGFAKTGKARKINVKPNQAIRTRRATRKRTDPVLPILFHTA